MKLFVIKHLLTEYTKLIYLLEKKCSLYSFLQFQNDENIKNIWTSIFQKFSTTNITVQPTIESNSINYYEGLTFPFILDEYSKIKELYQELIINKADLSPDLKWFKDNYRQKSLMKEHLNIIYQEKYIQNVFYQNMIRMILNDFIIPETHFDIICRIISDILSSDDFEQNIILIMEKKDLLSLLHKLIELFLKSNSNKEAIFEIISSENTENFDDEVKNSDLKSESNSEKNNPWVPKVSNLIYKLIEEVSSIKILSIIQTQENYTQYINSIDWIIDSFNQISSLEIKNSEKLEFLKQITRISSIWPLLSLILD